MSKVRIPIAICAVVGEVLKGSHASLDALFQIAGAPGPPPNLSHTSKWKMWLAQASNDPHVDSLAVLGRVIEEFMDVPPKAAPFSEDDVQWMKDRERLANVLEEYGLRYYRGGQVLPTGQQPLQVIQSAGQSLQSTGAKAAKPASVHELIDVLIKGLPRAMHPLTHRRKGTQPLSFDSEYDVQDLLHALLRPWVSDIRPEEWGPSYAGTTGRMDFLLPDHRIVLEVKRVRDSAHARKIGDELIIDVSHYRKHPKCGMLWCIIYDPSHLLTNPDGLVSDLENDHSAADGLFKLRVIVVAG